MFKYYFLILYFIVETCTFGLFSQNEKLVSDTYGCFPDSNEKVFVQTDKSVYVSGEPLLYKTYLLNASSLRQKSGSKVLYFDIVNVEKQVVQSWRTNVYNGMEHGKINLPDSLSAGIYSLMVYTNWMRNTSTDYYFRKQLVITKVSDKEQQTFDYLSLTGSKKTGVDFFPEGGGLVEGIPTRIGFCVHDNFIDTNAYLLIEKDKVEIEHIKIGTWGRGEFDLTPMPGSFYKAYISRNNTRKEVELPDIQKYGYTLKVKENGEFLGIRLLTQGIFKTNNINIFVFCRGRQVYAKTGDLTGGQLKIDIPTRSLPTGILNIVATDHENYIVAERLYYNDTPVDDDIFEVDAKIDNISTNDVVHFELSLKNLDKGDTAYLSVVVTEVGPFTLPDISENIGHYLHLYSEIGGLAEKDIGPNRQNDLDLLLLTTGLENYAWSLSHADLTRKCKFIREEHGFLLSGKILDQETQRPIRDQVVMLSVADSVSAMRYAYSDYSGNFHFLLNQQYDNRDLILQIENNKLHKRKVIWSVDKKEIDLDRFELQNHEVSATESRFLDNKRIQYLINSVYHEELNGHQIKTVGIAEGNFYGKPDYIVYPSDFIRLKNFTEIAENILPAVRFKKKDNEYFVQQFHPDTKILYPLRKHVLLNGVPFYDLEYISGLTSDDIRKIEISREHKFYGDLTFYGIVSIYTYDGTIPEEYISQNAFRFNNRVLNSNNNKSGISNKENNNLSPDVRSVLYWDPELEMAVNNNQHFSFQTSELKGTFKLAIQGITKSGKPIYESIFFNVN